MSTTNTINPLRLFSSDIPAALMAVSSLLSPRLPIVMREERRTASGKACGTSISPMYQKNLPSTSNDSPLPISSSTYRHRNCIISTNRLMQNVPMKSNRNCRTMNMSSFFMPLIYACWPSAHGILLSVLQSRNREHQ